MNVIEAPLTVLELLGAALRPAARQGQACFVKLAQICLPGYLIDRHSNAHTAHRVACVERVSGEGLCTTRLTTKFCKGSNFVDGCFQFYIFSNNVNKHLTEAKTGPL